MMPQILASSSSVSSTIFSLSQYVGRRSLEDAGSPSMLQSRSPGMSVHLDR